MILLQNKDGKTALDLAIEVNNQKSIELLLTYLLKLPYFSLSKVMYMNFGGLLDMNLKIFEEFLNTCYFKTYQMKAIVKANLKEKRKIVREINNSCILDADFYRNYRVPDSQGNLIIPIDNKAKSNAIIPSSQEQNSINEKEKKGEDNKKNFLF